jgi:hypothetical protein
MDNAQSHTRRRGLETNPEAANEIELVIWKLTSHDGFLPEILNI